MGNHTDSFCCAVTACLEAELSIPTEYVNNISWQEREHLFDLEFIQICWICGWPYVIKADRPDPKVELLVVPVPSGGEICGSAHLLFGRRCTECEPLPHFFRFAGEPVGL